MRFFFLLLLFLSACSLKPNYSRPDMPMPESYRFSPENAAEYVNLAWWEQFQDPILNELMQTALKNNQDIQIATARVLEFYSKYEIAFSRYFPQLGAGASVDRYKGSADINFFPLIPGVPRINNLYQLFMQLSYETDFWGKIRNSTEAAKYTYLAQVDARNIAILSLVSSLAKAYIQLKQFDGQLLISKMTYESRMEAWRIAQLRFDAGLVSEMEVKQAESEAEAAEVQIKNFEALIAEEENLISLLMGTSPQPIPKGKPLIELAAIPSIPVGLPSDLLENRPDILQAEKKMMAANAQIGVARASFFPNIFLTGHQGQITTDFNHLLNGSASSFFWGVSGVEPLYTGGALTGQLSEAEAAFVESVHSYEQTVLTALKEVSDALIAHEKAKEQLEIKTKQTEALAQYLKLAQLRYFNGQNDYLTVTNAEQNLFQSQLVQANLEAEVWVTLIDLYKALGQGWDVEADYCSKCDNPSPIRNALY